MSHSPPKKILCLHGLGQTGNELLKQLHPISKSLPSNWQFIAPDAPNAMPGLKIFDYMGLGNTQEVSSLSSTKSSPQSVSAEQEKTKKEKLKSLSLAIQAISVQMAAQVELEADSKRESKWSDGEWAQVMNSYLATTQQLIDSSPEVKEIYEDEKLSQGGKIENQEFLWSKLESLIGRKKKFPRSWSIQGEGWKGKGEWIGYSASFKLIAKVLREQGPVSEVEKRIFEKTFRPCLTISHSLCFRCRLRCVQFDGCIGFSIGGQFGKFIDFFEIHMLIDSFVCLLLLGHIVLKSSLLSLTLSSPRVAWCVQSLLSHSQATPFQQPAFQPFPSNQPPFKFLLTFSAIQFIEKNTMRFAGLFPPLSSPGTLRLYSDHSSGNFDRVPKGGSSVHSLSTWGSTDNSIPIFMMSSLALKTVGVELCTVHPGGHEIYLKEEWLKFYVDWLKTVNGVVGSKDLEEIKRGLPKSSLPLDTGVRKSKANNEKQRIKEGEVGDGKLRARL